MTTLTIPPEARAYSVSLEVRDVEATGRRFIEGRAVPYETWGDVGWFMEKHAQDSFKQSVTGGTGKRAPLLLFHDNRSFPIGHAEQWRHDDGLCGVWRLNDSTEAARAADAAASGDLLGMSVGFMSVRQEWDYLDWDDWDPDLGPDHKDKVTRLEARLLEVSLTPTPVFEAAEVQCVRTAFDIEARSAAVRSSRVRQVDAWRADVDRLRSGPSS